MLSINIAEIQTNKEDIKVFRAEYSEKLNDFRKNYPDGAFYRLNNNIYAWGLNPDFSIPEDFEGVTIKRQEDPLIFKAILENAIVSFFKIKDLDIYQKKYSSIWEVNLSKEAPVNLNGLSLFPRLEFEVNPIYSVSQEKSVIALSIRKSYKPKFTYSDDDFKKNSIDIRNWDRNEEGRLIVSPRNKKRFLDATRQESTYKERIDSLHTLKAEYESFSKLLKAFNVYKDSIYLPDDLKITDFNFTGVPNLYFKDLSISSPTYFFNNNRTGSGYYNDRLKSLQPYSHDSFSRRNFKICVFTPSENEGTTGAFINKLQTCLTEVFHASNVTIELIRFERDSSLEFINQLVNKADEGEYNLAITILSQADKRIDIKSSPYFLLKAKLLGRKIPTQKLTIETIRKHDPINQILNAIALNVYTKLGGTAWTIERDNKEREEIIVGISSTIDFNKNRVMGFANVFDYRGAYLLGSTSQISTMSNYSSSLEEHLKSTIQNQIDLKGIEHENSFRIIFHLSKPASRKYEIKAIENALLNFKAYNIQYAIVHLSYNHNYRIFNDANEKIPRGTYVQISTRQALLHLGNTSKTPILLRLDNRSVYDNTESMYKDLYSIAKQVLFFSHLSFRTFRPSNIPVTIQYPQLMSKLSSELRLIDDWDKSNLDIIKSKLWFI